MLQAEAGRIVELDEEVEYFQQKITSAKAQASSSSLTTLLNILDSQDEVFSLHLNEYQRYILGHSVTSPIRRVP